VDDVAVRPERPEDRPALHRLNTAAFGRRAEADLVDAVRLAGAATLSLVAELRGEVVGHLLLSPVTVEGRPGLDAVGLGPMAVRPELQGKGIGSLLVREGLAEMRHRQVAGVVVLGHPDYYPRFGFAPASRLGLRCEYDCPGEAFMALELSPGAFAGGGLVRYRIEFAATA
jgi:putative acetyltransferase